jgi:MFS family permease
LDGQSAGSGSGSGHGPAPRPAVRYRHYVLAVLFLGYVFSVIDRNILAAVLEPVRIELGLSDTEVSLLGGLAFAFFYATLGIPIARLADRWSRSGVFVLALAVWSAMTMLCGAVQGFATLFLARVGVGIGEAGGSPPAHSLISDYFRFQARGTALGVYALGVPIGISLGNLLGGWGNELVGWRLTFVLVGLPGLCLAVLAGATLRDPPRPGVGPDKGSIAEAVRFLWRKRSFRHLCLAASLHAFVWYGGSLWNNTYFVRVHGYTTGEAGSLMALVALFGIAGTFAGGTLSDLLARRARDSRWYVWVPGIAVVSILPFKLVAYLGSDLDRVVPAFAVMVFLASVFFGPSFAMTQALASIRVRAVATSILLFVQTLVGLGLGPLAVGMISDALRPGIGDRSVAYGLVAVGFVNLWSGVHYFLSARTLEADLDHTRRADLSFESSSGPGRRPDSSKV